MNIKDFLDKNDSLINDFIKMSHNAALRADYIQGGGGNTSVKLADDQMAIKVSGYSMGQITPENAYAVLDIGILKDFYNNTNPADIADVESAGADKTKEATIVIDGLPSLRPSVEAGFHSILDKFVLHSHAVYANLISCTKEGRQLLPKALEGADYEFAFIPYVNPGATLTFCIKDEVRKVEKETGKIPQLLLMENHGVIAHAATFEEAERIHDDANNRFAALFGVTTEDFPLIQIAKSGEHFVSDTPWLKEKLVGGNYTPKFFMEDSLYPDQLVFLAGNVKVVDTLSEATDKKCTISKASGEVLYNCPESEALVIEQTLCCIIFIVDVVKKAGFTLQLMDTSGKSFIAGWESEAYRKSLLK